MVVFDEKLKVAGGPAMIASVIEVGLGQQCMGAQIVRVDAQRLLGMGDALSDVACLIGPAGYVNIGCRLGARLMLGASAAKTLHSCTINRFGHGGQDSGHRSGGRSAHYVTENE